MYVILGATGHTGTIVANELLSKKKKVRVVGRDNQRLAAFTSRGAEAFTANVTDEKALSRAFTGAEAVYALMPPDLTMTTTGDTKVRWAVRSPRRWKTPE